MEEIDYDTKLSDPWVLYFHHVNDDKWSIDTFIRVCEINNVDEMLCMLERIPTFQSGMFFLMRGTDRSPLWNSIENIKGGMWTYKVPKKECDLVFKRLVIATCLDLITQDIINSRKITGLSVSPKINNLVIKIWTNSPGEKDASKMFIPIDGLFHNTTFFKLNKK